MSLSEHKNQILELVKEGVCVSDIAKIIGHSQNGVKGFLLRTGIQAKKKKTQNVPISETIENLKKTEQRENKFCVYLHRRASDRTIFYVGQGTEARAFNKSNRSSKWKQSVKESNGFFVEIVENCLSKDTALEIEDFLIQEIPNLINLPHSKSKFKEIDSLLVKELFYYDETSPSFLRHKKDRRKIKAGEMAGYQEKNKYWRVKVGKKIYLVHRLIFTLFDNKLSSNDIVDHSDGNPENNSIRNLRKTTAEENCRNRKIRADNSTGFGGIRKSAKSYSSSISIKGRTIRKHFSINKYGEDEAFRLIREWRDEMLQQLNIEFNAGYTERHGT